MIYRPTLTPGLVRVAPQPSATEGLGPDGCSQAVRTLRKPCTFFAQSLVLMLLCAGGALAEDPQLVESLPPVPHGPPGNGTGPAFAPSDDSRDLRWLLVSQNAQKALWQGLLGERRVRELERASFEMYLQELHPDREVREDEDYFRDLSETVGRSVGKVLRERLERRLDLDRRLGRERSSGTSVSQGFRLSPRIDVGSHNRLGAKLRFRDAKNSWRSRLSFQTSYDFEEDLYLKLVYEGRQAEAELRFIGDDEDFGQTLVMDVRFAF